MSAPQFWMSALATTIPVPCGAFMPVFVIGETLHPVWAQWEEGTTSQPTLGTCGCLQMSPSLEASGREEGNNTGPGAERALCPFPASLCLQGQPLGAWWGRAWQPGSLMASTRTATSTASCRGATPWWVSTQLEWGHHGGHHLEMLSHS